jgi:hypothetical protein
MTDPKLSLVLSSSEVAVDDWDLDQLRLPQDFAETAGVKKLLTTVRVHKPHKQDFVRVHPDPAFRVDIPVIDFDEEREVYLVNRALAGELVAEIIHMTMFTAINRQGVVFLWPVRLPDPNGKQMEWHRSAREGAEIAMRQWVRLQANMSNGAYDTWTATGVMVDPAWPQDVTFKDLLKLAFRDRRIDSLDHPVVKRLRGL